MKKTAFVRLCVAGLGIAFALGVSYLAIVNTVPHYTHSYDVAIGIQGDLHQIAEIETEFNGIIASLEDRVENPRLYDAQYHLQPDGAGTVILAYRFDGPGTAYSRAWERMTSQQLSGLLELCISLSDASVTHVTYSYGRIDGLDEAPGAEI